MMFVLIAGAVAFLVLGVIAAYIFGAVQGYRRTASAQGYASLGEFLRAAPRTDADKREAVDMMMQGMVLCVLGLAFPPLLLVGVFPLYFGGRKVSYSAMGLGLVNDAEQRDD
jgi:hypothetical protein